MKDNFIKLVSSKISNLLNETLGHSFYDLHKELGKECNNSRPNNTLDNQIAKLGFKYCSKLSDYKGESLNTKEYRICIDDFSDEKKNKLNHILNFYGYHNNGYHYYEDVYNTGKKYVSFTIEPIYNDGFYTNDTYYHATNLRSVNKILRQGLVPKDRDKLFSSRGERIYLIDNNSKYIFRRFFYNFEKKQYDPFVVLKVDLSKIKDKIKVYIDEMMPGAVYTYDNIPPYCLSIVECREDERLKIIYKLFDNIKQCLIDYNDDISITTNGNIDNKKLTIFGTFNNTNNSIDLCIDSNEGLENVIRIEGHVYVKNNNTNKKVSKKITKCIDIRSEHIHYDRYSLGLCDVCKYFLKLFNKLNTVK